MKNTFCKVFSCSISMVMMLMSTESMAFAYGNPDCNRIAELQQQITELSTAEYNVLNDFALEEGYSSINAMFDSFNTRALTYVSQSRIKDLNDSGNLDVRDAVAFACFLRGDYLYAYVYDEFDVTADYLVDNNDLVAYMQYMTQSYAYSAHGTLQTVDYTYEHRSYTKYDYINTAQSTYTLQDSTMLSVIPPSSSPNEFPSNTCDEDLSGGTNRDVSDLPSSCDDRIVRIGQETTPGVAQYQSTGFIVDNHVIATAAHCVYNRGAIPTLKFNPYRTVYAFTYQQNLDGSYSEVPHKLTIEYVAVPTAYTTCTDADTKWWDYGIIVVQEDLLEDYHAFSLGLVIEGAPRSKYDEPGAFDTTVIGFHGANLLPRYLTGTLYDYNLYRMTVESETPYGGASGCAVYCDDGNIDVVIGIIQSTGKHGMIISRPLLEFYYHAATAA